MPPIAVDLCGNEQTAVIPVPSLAKANMPRNSKTATTSKLRRTRKSLPRYSQHNLNTKSTSKKSDNIKLLLGENAGYVVRSNIDSEVIKPITASASPGKKITQVSQLSPIDKLLVKNGSIAAAPADMAISEYGNRLRSKSGKSKAKKVNTNSSKPSVPDMKTNGTIIEANDFQVFDMFWAPNYTTNYWPCILYPESDRKAFKKNSLHGTDKETSGMCFVRFFGCSNRDCWMTKQKLIPFKGFEDLLRNTTDISRVFPKAQMQSAWEECIKDAEKILALDHKERGTHFDQINRQQLSETSTTKDPGCTSDIGSLSDSNDSSFSSVAKKRNRSNSPSPDFSPISMKRPKFDGTEQLAAQLDDEEFQQFSSILLQFVGGDNTNKKTRDYVQSLILKIWKVKKYGNNYNADAPTPTNQKITGSLRSLSRSMSLLKRKEAPSTSPTPIATKIKRKVSVKLRQPPIEKVIDDILTLDEKYLFQGLLKEPICKYCHKPGNSLKKCEKGCHSWFHENCDAANSTLAVPVLDQTPESANAQTILENYQKSIELNSGDEFSRCATPTTTVETVNNAIITADINAYLCKECIQGEPRKCKVCNCYELDGKETPIACNMSNCGNAVHVKCLKDWPQAKISHHKDNSIMSFRCPSHTCHTCASDDPQTNFHPLSGNKMVKCIHCPATFHTKSTCIPAGSHFLSANALICPRHGKSKLDSVINVNWCLICVDGGDLTCCDSCPASIHPACLGYEINPDDKVFICDECQSGRLPLYGDVVWVKFNTYRWWPAIILPPILIPQNILQKKREPLMFVVRFFGSHDYAWISRKRVYLFAEGDGSIINKKDISSKKTYAKAVEEAKIIYETIQSRLKAIKQKDTPFPEPYVKIKVNRAIPPIKLYANLSNVNVCNCSPMDENPCGSESNCLNRCLFQQCNKKTCPAGDFCQNQMFATRISVRVEIFYTKDRGFGLKCVDAISAGTFVIEYVGEVINQEEFQLRIARKCQNRDVNYYFFSITKDYIIDAGPRGNKSRFINHSCDPNCETQVWSVNGHNRVGIFAIKDIPSGAELTFNYHWDDLLGTQKKTCLCGAANCVGEIGGKGRKKLQRTQERITSD